LDGLGWVFLGARASKFFKRGKKGGNKKGFPIDEKEKDCDGGKESTKRLHPPHAKSFRLSTRGRRGGRGKKKNGTGKGEAKERVISSPNNSDYPYEAGNQRGGSFRFERRGVSLKRTKGAMRKKRRRK